jgi:hypothetical protein
MATLKELKESEPKWFLAKVTDRNGTELPEKLRKLYVKRSTKAGYVILFDGHDWTKNKWEAMCRGHIELIHALPDQTWIQQRYVELLQKERKQLPMDA